MISAAVFDAMDILQHLRRGPSVLGFQINDLSADHAIQRSCAACDLLDNPHPCLRRTFQPRQNLVGLGLQRVSRQNRERFPEHLVAGRTAAPQIVVIQRRKIVVDQRVSVQHLQRRAQFLDFPRATTPATMRPASIHSTGRSRLPPANTLWRMAL